MDIRPNTGAGTDIAGEIAAAFAWWREAGVDRDYLDEAQDWLAGDEPEAASTPPLPPSRPDRAATPLPAIAREGLPGDLETFAAWWMTEPSLDGGRVADRVPPRGKTGAELMILVPHPEREDSGRLLSGAQGRLLEGMLAAMGLTADDVYLAAALPRHTPHADWAGIAAQGMGDILARHVALAAPRRLLIFGSGISPLLSNDPAKNPDDLEQFNHESGSVPLLVGRDLSMLLERPGWKARFWTRWLDWAPAVSAR